MGDRWNTSRIEAFSDGVFAIAITLLVLEISVPETGFEHLWKGIAEQWPSYLAYATSFLTIGGIWLAHHGIFGRLAAADATVLRLNLLLLMLVAFLPFPKRLIDETVAAERAAIVFYGLVMLSISTVIGVLWRYLARHRDLLEPDVADQEVAAITKLTTPSVGFYVVVVALALLAPRVAAFGYVAIAVVLVFRQQGDRPSGLSSPGG